jgi:predicted nucleic acid-binding protein
MIAVADSGPLISLAKLDYLHLLPVLYERVVIPRAVYDEVVNNWLAARLSGCKDR